MIPVLATLTFGYYLGGARLEQLPPNPIFLEILKVLSYC